MNTVARVEEIIEGSKLIANYMGFIHPYKCDIWRAGYCIKNVDLLSRKVFPSLEEVLASGKNNEAVPFFNGGNLHPGKYGLDEFWSDVIVFSTDSKTIHPCVGGYNERATKFHISWDWLMEVVIKINTKGSANAMTYAILQPYDIANEFHAVVEFIKWSNWINNGGKS